MESNQSESVTQPVESGASTEEKNVNLSKADNDFKRDMLRYKDEAAALKEQLKEIQLGEEQKKGNLEGVISTLKDEIKSLKQDNAKSKYNFANTQLDNAIKQEVLSRGVKEVDVFMKLIDEDQKGIVELDERFNANKDDVKGLVDKQLEKYGNIFKKQVNIVDAVPGKPVAAKKKDPKLAELSQEELMARAEALGLKRINRD